MGSVALLRPTVTSVTFSITYSANFGDRIYVTGSPSELGAWDLPSAVPLKWHPQHIWSVTVSFRSQAPSAPTRFEYKFFVGPASAPSPSPLWEPGINHVLDLAPGTPVAALPHRWGDGLSYDILPSHVPPAPQSVGSGNSSVTASAAITPQSAPTPAISHAVPNARGTNNTSAGTEKMKSGSRGKSESVFLAASPPPTPTQEYTPSPGAPSDPVSLAAARLAATTNNNFILTILRMRVPRSIATRTDHAVYVLGSIPALGSWNKAHSPRMRLVQPDRLHGCALNRSYSSDITYRGSCGGWYQDGMNLSEVDPDPAILEPEVDTVEDHDIWEVRIALPKDMMPTAFEYKYLVRHLPDCGRFWEPGPNRRAVIESDDKSLVLDDCWDKVRCVFSIFYPTHTGGIMHITGDPVEIGGWFRPGPKPMSLGPVEKLETQVDGRKWRLAIWLPRDVRAFSYRYAVLNDTDKTSLWEREPNRRADFDEYDAAILVSKAKEAEDIASSSITALSIRNTLTKERLTNGNDDEHDEHNGEDQHRTRMPDNGVRYLRDVNFVADMQFDHVPPNTIIGPYPQNAADVDALADAGATAVFNVQTDEDFAHRGIKWSALMERYALRNVRVVRFPIRDFDPQSLTIRIHEAAHALNNLIEQGHTVYVHCTAGMGRAPAVVVAYLCWVRGYSLDDAVAHVRKHRPVAVPNVNVLRRALEKPF